MKNDDNNKQNVGKNKIIIEEATVAIIRDIKRDILETRNKVIQNANRELIKLYFRIGEIISRNSSYGKSFVEVLAKTLKMDFPGATGFSERNLWRMKAFYEKYRNFPNLPLAVADLPWTHNYILLEKVKDDNKRIWYAEECLKNGWSKVVLVHQIELNLYDRQKLSLKMTNFKEKIESKDNSVLANEIIKDPYVFELEGLRDNYAEKELENKMMEKIKNVLLELGKGFSFIGNQYKISTENNDYYVDMLFYHLILHCYVVVELKSAEFKPEYVGQLGFYVKAVDEVLRGNLDNQTIGLLLCKEKDRLSVEWALDMINVPMGIASYSILDKLPTENDINAYMIMDDVI